MLTKKVYILYNNKMKDKKKKNETKNQKQIIHSSLLGFIFVYCLVFCHIAVIFGLRLQL